MRTFFALVAAASLLHAVSAQAALHNRGGGLIYDDVLDVTWLQNATYGAGSAYDDGASNMDGFMSWANASAWAANLSYYDSVRNVTYTDWRLPMVKPVNGVAWNYTYTNDGSTDFSYNLTSPQSELAYMFYVNLGNQGAKTTTGAYTSCSAMNGGPTCLQNVGPFVNLGLGAGLSWTGTDYMPDTTRAMYFDTNRGLQFWSWKSGGTVGAQAWAVRDGDVLTVPEADTWAMLLAGLGLVGIAARRRRG